MLGKRREGSAAYTVYMPVCVDKIHPFLAAVTACRAVKEIVCARIGLVKQGNEVILHGGLLCHIEAELAVHSFEVVACFIHISILLQFCPPVKSIACNLFGICLIGLRGAQGIIPELLDEDGINGTDKNTGIRKPCGNRLVVSPSVFHADFCLSVQTPDLFDQVIDSRLGVWNITGRHKDNITGSADGDGALAFRNINTNSVHNRYSFVKY